MDKMIRTDIDPRMVYAGIRITLEKNEIPWTQVADACDIFPFINPGEAA